jgi:hypothetical protein
MAKSRRKSNELAEIIVKGVIVLAFLGYGSVVKWWNSIPPEGRIFLIVSITCIIVGGLGSLWAFSQYRKGQRALAWKKAMTAWNNSAQAGVVSQHQSARYLSDEELEKFAAQVYAKMGYQAQRTGQTGDHGVDVRLINPEKQIELVQCKQWKRPVGEPQVRDLYGAMAHAKAVRGWLWAPNGFSEAAKRWAKKKPIVLVDDGEIGRLIESTYNES